MPQQDFTGNAKKTTLVGTLSQSTGPGGVFTVSSGGGAGHPTGALGLPWVETLDRNLPTEEKILCSARSGDNFTISQRGYDNTAAVDHQNGAPVEHTVDAAHLRTSSAHIYDTTRDDHAQYLLTTGARVITPTTDAAVGLTVNHRATASGDLLQLKVNGATKVNVTAAGLLVLSGAGGATHEANRVASVAQAYARGFALATDLATHQGGVTAGISISINRTDPAMSLNNNTGDTLRTYGGGTQKTGISASGAVTAIGQTHTFGRGGFGAGNAYATIGDDANGALVSAGHGTAPNTQLTLRPLGTGKTVVQNGSSVDLWSFDSTGNLVSTAAGAAMTFSGAGVFAFHNAASGPTSTPTNGGVLYAAGGALRWRGTAGTDTIIAPA